MNAPERLPTTAAECMSLAVIALDQAEKLVNGNAPDAHLVAAVARIGQGWAAVAMALLEAERSVTVELTEFDPPMQSLPALTPAGEEGWDHQHTSFCRHNWVRPMEPCANNCGQRPGLDMGTEAGTKYCPAVCRITDPVPPVTDVKLSRHLHDFDTTGRCTDCRTTREAALSCCPAHCDSAARQLDYADASEFRAGLS